MIPFSSNIWSPATIFVYHINLQIYIVKAMTERDLDITVITIGDVL